MFVLMCSVWKTVMWSCRHWCRYRASSPRKHNIPVVEFSLLAHFCTCSQTVCCDRQFFPVATYCTLLHRENGSFEVLCLHSRRLQQTAVSCKRSICNKAIEFKKILSRRIFPNTAFNRSLRSVSTWCISIVTFRRIRSPP